MVLLLRVGEITRVTNDARFFFVTISSGGVQNVYFALDNNSKVSSFHLGKKELINNPVIHILTPQDKQYIS